MAVGSKVYLMLTNSDTTAALAVTALNTAISTLQANTAVVYSGNVFVINSGVNLGIVAATGAVATAQAWAHVWYQSAT